MSNYPTMLIGPHSFLSRPITFSEYDALIVHFPYNDALIVTMHIDSYRVSKILVDSNSSVNILYGSALSRIQDTLEIA